MVGDIGGFDRSRPAAESQGKQSNGSVAGAGNVEHLARFGRDVMRRLVMLEKHHSVLAQGDENKLRRPFAEQNFPDLEEVLIFRRSLIRIGRGTSGGEKRFGAIGL